jgi:protein ImuB
VGADGSQHDVSQLIDTLGVRLGENNVFRLAPFESLLPERVVKRVPALHPAEGLEWPKNLPRPARLFLQPEKIEAVAELPDHPPRLFIWRNARHRVAKADGPERIHGEWWLSDKETTLIRDYYRVETADGTRYWLFRDGPTEQGGGWWLHGIGDT